LSIFRGISMPTPDLLRVCGAAFIWVFTILIVLACVMRLIIMLFPKKPTGPDAALIAAVGTVVSAVFPGGKMTHIEEKQ